MSKVRAIFAGTCPAIWQRARPIAFDQLAMLLDP
jgi:hypothetical protein